ncbi:hypothetical protein FM112_12165 [Gulosibacter sp. 10]|nr:hypothetical protein FM112_12165 [Gulosibacter sp. 10]
MPCREALYFDPRTSPPRNPAPVGTIPRGPCRAAPRHHNRVCPLEFPYLWITCEQFVDVSASRCAPPGDNCG